MRIKIFLIIVLSLLCLSCEKDRMYEAGTYMCDGQLFSLIPAAVSDVDGNSYDAVKIGKQVWMKQNLRTTKYADGTPIAHGSDTSSTQPYWYYTNNDLSITPTYGLLYNWKAVMRNSYPSDANPSGIQGICPNGWHVPSSVEWDELVEYVSSQSRFVCDNVNGNVAKALASSIGWQHSNTSCTPGNKSHTNNATGFSSLPAGGFSGGGFSDFCEYAHFWSASGSSGFYSEGRGLCYEYTGIYNFLTSKSNGCSVRCLRDALLPTITTNAVSNITPTTAICGGNVEDDGGGVITARGVCWNTNHNPTISGNHTSDGNGTGSFISSITGLYASTTYYVRAYATNSAGTAYGDEVIFNTNGNSCAGMPNFNDIDGNTYSTVQIGNQCWMRENLRTTKYADGTIIEQGEGISDYWGYWYYPNNDTANKQTYGLLYNWSAVMRNNSSSNSNPSNVQGICPDGWHLPSSAEWTQLTDYVRSQSQYWCSNNNTSIAKSLSSITGWSYSSIACTPGNNLVSNNTTGFGALPAGFYDNDRATVNFSSFANFWSATENGDDDAGSFHLYYREKAPSYYTQFKHCGLSVRCIKD